MSVVAPEWCTTATMRRYWARPYSVPLSRLRARRFKRRLWEHGYVTPNYTRAEAASHDGVDVPSELRSACQRQGLHLERVRHGCGDKPLPVLSWYRSRSWNAANGGATDSQHLYARASDIAESIRQTLGGTHFDDVCQRVFAGGGIGTQTVYGGPVRHVDCRRGPARWVY